MNFGVVPCSAVLAAASVVTEGVLRRRLVSSLRSILEEFEKAECREPCAARTAFGPQSV